MMNHLQDAKRNYDFPLFNYDDLKCVFVDSLIKYIGLFKCVHY